MFDYIYIGSSNLITADKVLDVNGGLVSGASVSLNVYKSNGDKVLGVEFPITLSEDQDNLGTYRGIIPPQAELSPGVHYTLETIVEKDGEKTIQRLSVKAIYKNYSK